MTHYNRANDPIDRKPSKSKTNFGLWVSLVIVLVFVGLVVWYVFIY